MCKLKVGLIFLVSVWGHTRAAQYCNPNAPVASKPGAPPFPVYPPTFQTRLEINIMEKNMTISGQEYFDKANNRATIIMASLGAKPVSIVYDYANNQLFYITSDGTCTTSVLSNDTNSFLFGNIDIGGTPHELSTNGALHFVNTSTQAYMGQTTVRGITVDHYQTCLHWAFLNATFTLDYYITALNWAPYTATQQIPVRAVAKGTSNSVAEPVNFQHIYEYFDFRFDLTVDDEIFETPRGVICKNRKHTKPVPVMPTAYHYRQEIVTQHQEIVQIADIYYDGELKLVRYDYRNLDPAYPTYSTNPLSEIHDFNRGVRYIKDAVVGNCSVYPLTNTSFDILEGQGTFKGNNGSGYVLHMKNPMQFLYIDKNYTYTGQRKARGVLCDVYTGIRSDYNFGGTLRNATFEYYFLNEFWNELPDDSSGTPTVIPYMLVLTILDREGFSYLQTTYNFIDYDSGPPDMSVFDVSRCYSEQANLQFQIRFPGTYKRNTESYIRLKARDLIALHMNVSSPIRVQDVRVDYDNSNIYISAKLLDRAPPSAQFTLISGKEIEQRDDLVYDNVPSSQQCAKYCVENPNFICNSFDYCSKLGPGNCRLSKAHIGDGTSVVIDSTCDHYSRTINGPTVQEMPIDLAFENLRNRIFQNLVRMEIFDTDDGSVTTYQAVDVQILFGWLDYVPLPSMTGQFSYGLEIVVPSLQQAYSSGIWYDSQYKLVRYDLVHASGTAPLYDVNPMTTIHDFNTGLAYNIDRVLGNCTINAIASNDFDSKLNTNTKLTNGAYVVQMKNPLELFALNETYKWAGQRTIRGILCDVFETTTTDFKIAAIDQSFISKLQFSFMSDQWAQVSDKSNLPVNVQPMRMDVSSEQVGLFITYNFYNFNEQDPDLTNFDISPCFTGDQQRQFLIRFPGQYHAFIEKQSKTFLKDSLVLLAAATKASPLRFQNLELVYDQHYIKIVGTIVEQAPFIDDFTLTAGTQYAPASPKISYSNISSDAACATLCRQDTGLNCKGFDYCKSTKTCILSPQHAFDKSMLIGSAVCDHYSRTVDSSSTVQPTIDGALFILKNQVYQGAFKVPVRANSTTIIYTADLIRDDVLRSDTQDPSSFFKTQFAVSKNNVLLGHNDGYFPGLSVDECSVKCLSEVTFRCLSFDYCYKTGDCILSKAQPENEANSIQPHDFCDLYSRSYLNRYTVFEGKTYSVTADLMLPNIASANLCAKECTEARQIQCKSFQFCNSSRSCGLLKTHQLDLPVTALQTSPTCSFYSRSYIDDFQLSGQKQIQTASYTNFYQVDVNKCAKMCIDMEINNCKSFVFCNSTNGTICRVTSLHPRQGATVLPTTSCDLYTRYYFPRGQKPNSTALHTTNKPITPQPTTKPQPQTRQPTTKPQNTRSPTLPHQTTSKTAGNPSKQGSPSPQSTGYSAGAMAAVGIFLFIPGMVIGAGALFFWKRRQEQNKTGEDFSMTTNFVSRADDE